MATVVQDLRPMIISYAIENGILVQDENGLPVFATKRPLSVPAIKKTVFNGDTTVIIWEDGEKTVVTREGEKPYDKYAAFTAAVCKRLFGGTSNVMKVIRETDESERARAKANEKRLASEAEKARRAMAQKLRAAKHKAAVDECLARMRAERDALAILSGKGKNGGASPYVENC